MNVYLHKLKSNFYNVCLLNFRLTSSSKHLNFWDGIYKVIDEWKVVPKNGKKKAIRPPSQNGWLVTIRGIQRLWETIRNLTCSSRPIKYLILRTVNQDALENAFGCIRSHCGSNCNPNVGQFVAAFKTSIINGLAHQDLKRSGNCEEDNAQILSNLQSLLFCDSAVLSSKTNSCNATTEQAVVEESSSSFANDSSAPDDWSSTAYVSGFIARRILSFISCENCINSMLASPTYSIWAPSFHFKEFSKEQPSLFYPSEGLCRSVGLGATLLEEMIDTCVEMSNVRESISSVIYKNIKFDWIECLEHKNTVVKEIIASVCKIGIPWWCKKKNRSLKERNE